MTTTTFDTTGPSTITLADGRKLGYAEFGDRNGRPVFAFPGYGGSRLGYSFVDGFAREQGVRVISVERPGMGASTFQPKRTLLDWPADVTALADALGLQRFAVAGASGGGPYVAACAYRIPDRLTSAAIISGVGPIAELGTKGMMPMNRLIFGSFRYAPPVADAILGLMSRMGKNSDPERTLKIMLSVLPESDKRALREHPDIVKMFSDDSREASVQGPRGTMLEGRLYVRPWGFRLEDITMPVHVWQGDQDRNVPLSHGEYLARTLAHGTLHLCPGDGHFVMYKHMPEILRTLAPAE